MEDRSRRALFTELIGDQFLHLCDDE